MLETSTATETAVNRECARIALFLGPDTFDLQFATKELARDMQTLIMLSTLRLRRSAWYLVGATDVSPFFVYSDEPGTMLVWADADWSGDAMTCKSTSAGAVQLEKCGIEAWSVVQQVVSFSSDESESHVTEMSKVDRWETLDHRSKSQDWRVSRDSCRRRVEWALVQAGETARRLEWWKWLTRSPHSRWMLVQEEQSKERGWFGV